MENRKKVYFERQQVVEYWTYTDLHGFKQVDNIIGDSWPLDSFNYKEQTCSKESFDDRKYGYIPLP